MELGKNTVVSVSIGTIMGLAWAIWIMTSEVQSYTGMIHANAQAIQAVVQSLELSRVDREIAGLKRERRDLRRDLRIDPNNDLLLDQLIELDDAIDERKDVRECIVDPDKEVCE